jgi:hypothetical protein
MIMWVCARSARIMPIEFSDTSGKALRRSHRGRLEMPLSESKCDAVRNLVGLMRIPAAKAEVLYEALHQAGLLDDASQAFMSLLRPRIEAQFHDSPEYPLDLMKLAILPPPEWSVSLCEGGVIIGAWVDTFKKDGVFSPTLYKRFFKFKDGSFPGSSESSAIRHNVERVASQRNTKKGDCDCEELTHGGHPHTFQRAAAR